MKIPIHQTNWYDIDLEKIAKNISHPLSKLADEEFDRAFYHELLVNKRGNISESWVQKKHNLSDWLLTYINQNSLEKLPILSLGCGIGIVEQPLLKARLKVDLQECQEFSIQYLKNNHPSEFEKTKFILSLNLEDIPNDAYDVVLAIGVTYALSDTILSQFVHQVKRILKKGGIFIWCDPAITLKRFILYKYQILRGVHHAGVLWGWQRSIKIWDNLAATDDLVRKELYFFDEDINLLNIKSTLGRAFSDKVYWQMGIYQK